MTVARTVCNRWLPVWVLRCAGEVDHCLGDGVGVGEEVEVLTVEMMLLASPAASHEFGRRRRRG